jgi:hypothetical protein
MPIVPAVCDTCGAIFSSGISIENSTHITFAGSTAGPCPNCGARGHIPDGTYNFTQDTIELLRGPDRTVSDLERLAQILREARQRRASVDEVKETIQQEAPNLSTLADLLPQTRSELYGFIQIVLAAIALVLTQAAAQNVDIQDVDIDVNQVIGITIEQQTRQPNIQPQQQEISKVGRNDPCPCGSGKKYKRCHGDPLRQQEN